jgi:cytochrome P450
MPIPSARAPGPQGFLENLNLFRRFTSFPPRGVRHACDLFGDVVHLRVLGRDLVLVGDPALAGEVMQDKDAALQKDWVTRGLHLLLGKGLLTSEGDLWKKQRRLIAPSLSKKQIGSYADTMVRCAETWASRLHTGEVRAMHADMTEVTLEIVVETLFGTPLSDGHGVVGKTLDHVMTDFQALVQTWRQFFPEGTPFAARRNIARAGSVIDGIVFPLIEKRRAQIRAGETLGDDLLSRLLLARDDNGEAMTDQQLRDECVTMFLAGHETTANALTFAWLLLAEHPEVSARMASELETTLGDRLPTLQDVSQLPWTEAVLKETLRIRPPAHIFGREATRDFALGPYRVPRGATVLVSPWALHHDARFFPDPFAFRPQRWLDGSMQDLPKNAYLPFGGGARVCIGNHFALMEAILVLATAGRRHRFERVDDTPVELQAAVTLRPKHDVRLRVASPRAPAVRF